MQYGNAFYAAPPPHGPNEDIAAIWLRSIDLLSSEYSDAVGSPCTLDKVPDACLAAVSMCGSAAAMRSPAPFLAASHAGPAPSYTAACAFASIRRSCPNQPTPQARRVESTPQQGTRSAIRLR
eukprot:9376256-Pyramimonas_sp.AAC.1